MSDNSSSWWNWSFRRSLSVRGDHAASGSWPGRSAGDCVTPDGRSSMSRTPVAGGKHTDACVFVCVGWNGGARLWRNFSQRTPGGGGGPVGALQIRVPMDTAAAADMLPRPAVNYSIFLECGLYGDACAPASLKNAVFPSTASSDSVLGTPAQPSWNAKECPAPFDELYCFNGGQCFAEYLNDDDADFVPLCKCAPNFHGRRCEFLFNPEIYGFSVSRNELETAALSTLVTLVVLAIFAATCCMYLYRRYGKEREILYMASYGETGRSSDIIPFTTSTRRFRQSRLAAIRSVSPGFPTPYATSTEYSSHRHVAMEERQRFLDTMPMTTMHSVVSS